MQSVMLTGSKGLLPAISKQCCIRCVEKWNFLSKIFEKIFDEEGS
jgi:hypothetical protein